MNYPIANNYIDTLERVKKQLFDIAFTDRHPEPLAYEEIQAMTYEILNLDIMKLYREAVSSESLRLYKGMFYDILSNRLVTNGTARRRIMLLPYYPSGVTLIGDNGNKIIISTTEGRLIGTEMDDEGKELAKHDVISYLFNGDMVTKRLQDEGRNSDYILFFLSQTNQLQEAIFERWDDVRVMFEYIEKGNLKKYSKDFGIDLLEKAKEKPKVCNTKTIVTNNVNSDSVEESFVLYNYTNTFIVDYRKITRNGQRYDLLSFLKGGYSKRGTGCLRPGVDCRTLRRALEGCVVLEISNRNRLDILCYTFSVFADLYIAKKDREKYKESIMTQAEKLDYRYKDNLPTDIKQAINELLKP